MEQALKILFLLQTAEHVRFRKRVALLMAGGAEAEVLAFERKSYPGRMPQCAYGSLGSLEHQSYLKRVRPFLRAVRVIRARAKDNQVIYAFGLDMLLLGWLASAGLRKKLVYEVGDIREVLIGSGVKNRLFRLLERFLIKRTDLLVVTSGAYLDHYFYKVQGLSGINNFVLENKLDRQWFPVYPGGEDRQRAGDYLTIGYYGVLRCKSSWEILKALAEESEGAYRVYLRGISREIDIDQESSSAYIEYGGPYLVPDDLPEVYGRADLVWACYPYQGQKAGNWQWAKTVRFYEACYFQKPLIVQAGTEDSRVVEKYQIGLVVDMNAGIKAVVEELQEVTRDDLDRWSGNLRQLPEEIYLYNGEHKELLELIRQSLVD